MNFGNWKYNGQVAAHLTEMKKPNLKLASSLIYTLQVQKAKNSTLSGIWFQENAMMRNIGLKTSKKQ